MKKAFTLVELLVVIGIIAILMSIMLVTMGGGSESGRNATCMANLSNLAKATAGNGKFFPLAGSVECRKVDESRGIGTSGSAKYIYWECPGWLSWYSNGAYGAGNSSSSHLASSSWFVSAYASVDSGGVPESVAEMRRYCITNAALKATLEKNSDILVCPQHKLDMKSKKLDPFFSYVMNSYFKWDDSQGSKPKSEHFNGVRNNQARGDKILLFAELPWKGWAGNTPSFTTSPGTDCDCTLQYTEGEVIGFNHKKGKVKVAHVAFADGHTETLQLPKNGMSQSELEDLTKWLCEGKDIGFEDGRGYKEME